MNKTPFVTKEQLDEIVKEYPTPFHLYDEKGIRENVVIIKHGLKNALPPIVTVLGMRIAALMTGAIMIETIFSWPGIGRLIVDAINNNDFEMIQGTVLFMAILYVTVNLVVDIIYLYINPKVSYESERRAG